MSETKEVIRVALADDHAMVLHGLISILNEHTGFEVVAAGTNGEELIAAVEKLAIPPDVCLLDINMPRLNGYDTLKYLHEKYPEMKFLVLSVLDHEFVVLKMLRLGANGYLLKEDGPNVLKKAIETVYERDFYHSDLVNGHLITMAKNNADYNKLLLNDLEMKFLALSCSEMTYKEIAGHMQISERTVEKYRNTLFEKLNVKSRTGLAIYALKLGLVNIE